MRIEHFSRFGEIPSLGLLQLKGFRVDERRFHPPVGDIDLIFRRGKRMDSVMVNARRDSDSAADAVPPTAF